MLAPWQWNYLRALLWIYRSVNPAPWPRFVLRWPLECIGQSVRGELLRNAASEREAAQPRFVHQQHPSIRMPCFTDLVLRDGELVHKCLHHCWCLPPAIAGHTGTPNIDLSRTSHHPHFLSTAHDLALGGSESIPWLNENCKHSAQTQHKTEILMFYCLCFV
uniref:Putative secreted protein n=1 Tax=Anopheles marajoara TaxID=58244 RepID=A0A2M4C635_9DIPT